MKRNGLLLLIVGMALLLCVAPVRADKSYVAERFDVLMDVQPGGAMIVTETVVFRFDGGPFTYAFREVLANETDGLRFVEASMDGTVLPQGTSAGMVEVTPSSDRLKVTWHFAPATDETHTFVLRYEVLGVVRMGTTDAIRWRAIPADHDYPIAAASVQVRAPVAVQAPPTLNRAFEAEQTSDGWLLTSGALAADEELIVSVDFPSGSLVKSTSAWQVQQEQRAQNAERAGRLALIGGMLSALLGGVILAVVAQAHRRSLDFVRLQPLAEPPSDLSPALVGHLVGAMQPWAGIVLDLAQRGVLEIQQSKGFLGSKRYQLVRLPYAGALSLAEQQVLSALFDRQPTIELSQVGTKLEKANRALRDLQVEEMVRRGWLDPQRVKRRTTLIAISVLALLVSLGGLFVGLIGVGALMQLGGVWLSAVAVGLGIAAGLFTVSVPAVVMASSYSPLTPLGEEQKVRWKAFGEYLRLVCRGREAAVRPDLFERYLPFAAVFGLTAQWARYFEKLGGVPLPVWFRSLSGNDADFTAFVAAMSESDSSFSGVADGGGGGASGGGSSGAG